MKFSASINRDTQLSPTRYRGLSRLSTIGIISIPSENGWDWRRTDWNFQRHLQMYTGTSFVSTAVHSWAEQLSFLPPRWLNENCSEGSLLWVQVLILHVQYKMSKVTSCQHNCNHWKYCFKAWAYRALPCDSKNFIAETSSSLGAPEISVANGSNVRKYQ